MTMSERDHPLAKGTPLVEKVLRDPPPSHSVAFLLGTLAFGAISYIGSGYINSVLDSLLSSPTTQVLHSELLHTKNAVVNLGYASYKGLLNDSVPDVISWLGVPYAQPPRRFRAAHPLDETPRDHEIADQHTYPPFCVQGWAPWTSRKYGYPTNDRN